MKQLNRWVYAIVGVIVLLFAGLVYAWSVLSTPIAAEFTSWTKAQLSMTFTIVMILFCIGSLLCGLLSGKLSAKMSVRIGAVLFLLGFLIGRGHTGGGDDEEYDDEPPRTPAKPLIPEERHTARVPRLVPREESSDSEPAVIPDKTPAAPMTPAAPAETPAPAERSAQDEPTQADEDEVRTMSLDDLLDDIHNM